MSKKITIESTQPAPPALEERTLLNPTDAVDEAEIQKIEDLLKDSELAGGSIRLDRKGPSDSSYQYCTKMRVNDGLDLDLIKRVWGGGDYKAKTFRSNGQVYKQFAFSIDYRIKGSMDTTGSGAVVGSTAAEENKSLAQLASIFKPDPNASNVVIKMMEQSSAQNNQMLTLLMAQQQQSSQQMMAMMTAMATAMGNSNKGGGEMALIIPVLTAMISKPERAGDKPPSVLELVTALKELKEITGGAPAATEEKEKEDMWDKVMKYGGPVLAALMTKTPLQMPGNSPAMEAPQLPPPSVKPLDAGAPNEGLPPEFKAYINMILGAAAKNAETGTYADLIADSLDEQQSTILCGILQHPDWIGKLAETDRRVLSFAPWFTRLRADILETYGINESTNTADEGNHAPSDGDVPIRTVAPVINIPGVGGVS